MVRPVGCDLHCATELTVFVYHSQCADLLDPDVAVGTFVVEQRHGFNKQTPLLYFKDQIKTVSLRSDRSVVAQQLTQGTLWQMLCHNASSV